MKKRLIPFVLSALLFSACTGKNNSRVDPAQHPRATATIPSILLPVAQVVVRSASYTITDLTHARDELLWSVISAKDLDRLSTFGILQELLDTELRSVENQLESDAQQSKLGTFDVTMNPPARLQKPIE